MTTPENASPEYDVFISYSHCDEKWVSGWLLPRLVDAGLRVCIDVLDFELGAFSLEEMKRAVLQSRKTLLVLTPDYLASKWAKFERNLALTLDPAALERRVIPILLKPCDELPSDIGTRIYLDFTIKPRSTSKLDRLISALREPDGSMSIAATDSRTDTFTPALDKPPSAAQWVASRVSLIRHAPVWQRLAALLALLAVVILVSALVWPNIRPRLYPAGSVPVRSIDQVVIELDGMMIDATGDRCQEVACSASHRVEIKLQDAAGARLPPDDFLYTWRFDPPDPGNADLPSSKNYAVVYTVPCRRDNQTVTVEVLRDQEPVAVRRICFNIDSSP